VRTAGNPIDVARCAFIDAEVGPDGNFGGAGVGADGGGVGAGAGAADCEGDDGGGVAGARAADRDGAVAGIGSVVLVFVVGVGGTSPTVVASSLTELARSPGALSSAGMPSVVALLTRRSAGLVPCCVGCGFWGGDCAGISLVRFGGACVPCLVISSGFSAGGGGGRGAGATAGAAGGRCDGATEGGAPGT
jgi:hypothetical protein